MHIVTGKKDRFTISSTSFQGNDYMSSTITSPSFPSVDWTNNLKPYSERDSFTGNLGALSLSTTGGANVGFSVANLRSAFALDKLYRLSAQAGDGDYKSQIKARYGFTLMLLNISLLLLVLHLLRFR